MITRTCVPLVLFSAAAVLALNAGCSVTHRVERVDRTQTQTRDGIYYWLPETIVVADVQVVSQTRRVPKLSALAAAVAIELKRAKNTDTSKTETTKPETTKPETTKPETTEPETNEVDPVKSFDDALVELFGLDAEEIASIKLGSTSTSIKNVALRTQSRPDQSAMYFVSLAGGGSKRDLELQLSQEGILTDGKSKVDDRTLDNVVSVVKIAADIAGKIIPFGGSPTDVKSLTPSETDAIAAAFAKQFKIAEDRLKEARESRAEFLRRGIAGGSVEAHELLLKELDDAIEAAEVPFLGERETTISTHSFRVRPNSDHCGTQQFDLATFQPEAARTFARSIPVERIAEPSANPLSLSRGDGVVPLVLSITSDNRPPTICPSSDSPVSGFAYRIPASAAVVVAAGGRTLKFQDLPIAQFGSIARLPGRVGGKVSNYDIALHPDTGGLKKLSVSSEPPDLSKLSGLSDATSSITKALAERDAADSPASQLKAQNDLLKQQIENLELLKKLENLQPAAAPTSN